jgi:hypothetical protein
MLATYLVISVLLHAATSIHPCHRQELPGLHLFASRMQPTATDSIVTATLAEDSRGEDGHDEL